MGWIGPVIQRVDARAAIGTGFPWLLTTLSCIRSSGCMRSGASTWTMTPCSRPAFGSDALNDVALQACAVREVVDVRRSERGRQHGIDVVEQNAERAGAVAV